MNAFDSLFSPDSALNEQIARQIFDVLPESGPIMIIIGKDGNYWPSDSEAFAALNISETFIKELCDKIDDGDEPVMSQHEEVSLIATQLSTEKTNCGYVIIALPQYSPESTLVNIDLIEIALNQVNLVARLIEKNAQLYELQIKNFSLYEQGQANSN